MHHRGTRIILVHHNAHFPKTYDSLHHAYKSIMQQSHVGKANAYFHELVHAATIVLELTTSKGTLYEQREFLAADVRHLMGVVPFRKSAIPGIRHLRESAQSALTELLKALEAPKRKHYS